MEHMVGHLRKDFPEHISVEGPLALFSVPRVAINVDSTSHRSCLLGQDLDCDHTMFTYNKLDIDPNSTLKFNVLASAWSTRSC